MGVLKIEFHPVAELFPMMIGKQFQELVDDIKANGLQLPIWKHDGKIVDGRNRYLACIEAGVEPRFKEWRGTGSLEAFVISLNIPRRHLTDSQKAIIVARLATRSPGLTKARETDRKVDVVETTSTPSPTVGELAAAAGVHRGTVQSAKRVLSQGAPEVIAAVESGDITIHAAEKIIEEPREKQVVAMARHKLLKGKRPRPEPLREELAEPPEADGNQLVNIKIDVHAAASTAAEMVAALPSRFLAELVEELNAILGRMKSARERGFAPVGKD